MDAIEEIEKKLSDYENQYITENKILRDQLNEFMEKEKLYKDEILSLYNQVNELKIITSNHNIKREFDSKIIKEENIQLKDEYNLIKSEYDKIKKELNDETMKNELLMDKYNKLVYLYDQKEKENFQLLEQLSKNKMIDLEKLEKKENNEKNEILSFCNNTLSIFIKWIEINLISLNNSRNNNFNASYSDYIHIEKNDLFIFDKLKESLLKAKNILDNNFANICSELDEERQKANEYESQNFQYNKLFENIYTHLYQEIDKEKYFDINSDGGYEADNFYFFNEIENMINKTFELLKKIKESSYDKSLDKLIEDNTQLSKEIEVIKSKMVALYNDNKTLYKYKNELEKLNGVLKQQLSNKELNQIKNDNKI